MQKPDLHKEIRHIIGAYYKMPKSGVDVETLMNMQRHLACLKYGLAVESGGLYEEKNGAEYRRKAGYASRRQEAITAGESGVRAESAAAEATAELLKDELSADAAYKASALILDAVEDVLRAMSQQISNLKQERQQEMIGRGSQAA